LQITIINRELKEVDHFKYLGSVLTRDGYCTREIKMKIAIAKEAFNRKKLLLTSKLNIELNKKLVRFYVWSIALYGSETWTLRKLERKYLESFETWCFRRMEKIKCSEKVTNEQVLDRIREKRTLLNNILRRNANCIGHILRRNCFLPDAIEGEMTEVKGVRRRTKLLDDLRNRRRYWELKEEAEDRKRWRRQFINRTSVSSISPWTC
jgi:hypothetical protein